MKQCKCGSRIFWGHNVYHLDVKVDENKQCMEDGEVYDSIEPYGPFQCHECGTEYDEWEDIPEAPDGQVSEDPVPPEPRKFDAVFFETPLDKGINAGDMTWMAANLNESEFLPLEIQAESSAAIGLIGIHFAESLSYSYNILTDGVKEIMEEVGKERKDCVYSLYNPECGYREFVLAHTHMVF